jgi:hypothetical protein
MPGKLERGFSEGDKKRLIARLALLQIKSRRSSLPGDSPGAVGEPAGADRGRIGGEDRRRPAATTRLRPYC